MRFVFNNIAGKDDIKIPVVILLYHDDIAYLPWFRLTFKNEVIHEIESTYLNKLYQKENEFVLRAYLNTTIGMNVSELTNYIDTVNLITKDLTADQFFSREMLCG